MNKYNSEQNEQYPFGYELHIQVAGLFHYIRGHDYKGHRPHFVHYKNSMCPTVPKNHNPYNQFRNLPRDVNLAKENKKWVWENLN
ncbi:hypothetical protein MOQ95_005495, partial [Salmonella enterica]|nr:hypothetical protein [Salmonella enterica]